MLFELVAIDATCNGDDCTGLACTWRAVEEEMRNAVLLNKLFDWVGKYVNVNGDERRDSLGRGGLFTRRGDVLVGYDVVQRYRSILFDPLHVGKSNSIRSICSPRKRTKEGLLLAPTG